ncbi:MAG: D-alanyl-D-alanine carboxypeptidase/D-alanyl-D-alanine-endopeptidase [Casimicrobiaceae bacterium]|nr:D-alanyl-D-alanine carboxypeptidase/D-alanyl-D-alanine-endopeptidase [Casimicrobiaceae bacterium]
MFNFKSVGFRFRPREDGRVEVGTEGPTPDGLVIEHDVRAIDEPCGDWRARLQAHFSSGPNAARASFRGRYPSACGERDWYVSLFDHNGLIAGTFARLWRDAGGHWHGLLRDGRTPPGARVLAVHRSAPLTEAITDINKASNNVMTRQLVLTLDAELNGPPARLDRLTENARRWARARGIEAHGIVVENGSGLSRLERLSARQLAQVLEYGMKAPWAAEFVASLPVAGVDGTLARRLTGGTTQGRAFLKTGTLAGVKSLAGYLERPDGRRLLFVGFVNHPHAEAAEGALDFAVQWYLSADHARDRSTQR